MPDTSASLYEQLFPLTTVMKQRVVDNFSGDSVNERWTELNVSSTPTYGMVDGVDGGAFIKTNTTNNCQGKFTFNNIRQYEPTGAVCISVWKTLQTTSVDMAAGIMKDGTVGNEDALSRAFTTVSANYVLSTGDASTESHTASSVAIDTNYHSHKVECGSVNVKHTIDGVLETTKTTNRPTFRLQPIVQARTLTTAIREINITYIEAYNT